MAYDNIKTFGDDETVSGAYGIMMDLNYHTEYAGGIFKDSSVTANPEDFKFKQYSLKAEATLDLVLNTKWFDFYQANYDAQFIPIRATPYTQYIIWQRPIVDSFSFENFDVNFFGGWRADVLQLETTVTEWAKTTEKSIYDYIEGTSDSLTPQEADFVFNPDYEMEAVDKYWSLDLSALILSDDLLANLNKEKPYYNWWILGKYTW